MSDAEWKDGIPPVGTLVEYVDTEYRGESGEWVDNHIGSSDTAIFIAKYKGDYILAYKDMSGGVVACSIRPIKTAADIEREEAIDQMTSFLIGVKNDTCADCAKALVKAGYRLPVEQGEVVSYSNVHHEFMRQHEETITSYLTNNFTITRKPKS